MIIDAENIRKKTSIYVYTGSWM